jgi:CRISPR/Cas system-associated exonuclease Cas4 (RecB family)
MLATRGLDYVLVDIKTYRRLKSAKELESAKMQVAMYAIALKDWYQIDVAYGEIVYAPLDHGLQVVRVEIEDYRDAIVQAMTQYHLLFTPSHA